MSFCSFQTRYSFHWKFWSINYFVLSLRKEHIRSCIVVVSEREYKEFSCFATFLQRLKRDLNQTSPVWHPTSFTTRPLAHGWSGRVNNWFNQFFVHFIQKCLEKTTARFEPHQEVTPKTVYHYTIHSCLGIRCELFNQFLKFI